MIPEAEAVAGTAVLTVTGCRRAATGGDAPGALNWHARGPGARTRKLAARSAQGWGAGAAPGGVRGARPGGTAGGRLWVGVGPAVKVWLPLICWATRVPSAA